MRQNECNNKPALLQKQVSRNGGHAHEQCGWKCKRHGELAESGCLISVEGVPFSREEPQYKHKEYGQQCAHKAADIHDLYLSFRLKLHFRAKPQNHRVMSSTADVRVILDNGLEEKHRQRIYKHIEFDRVLRFEGGSPWRHKLLAQSVLHVAQ